MVSSIITDDTTTVTKLDHIAKLDDLGYLDKVITGDSKMLSLSIPDNSIDLVFCDPVWQNVLDYTWIANTAKRVLVYGGNLLAQSCSEYLFAHHNVMVNSSLLSFPVLCEALTGLRAFWKYRVSQAWKPYIWFSKVDYDKPTSRKGDHVADAYKAGPRVKDKHPWQDHVAFFAHYIAKLTDPNDIVFDPFCGTGVVAAACIMLNRHFVTFELDPETAEIARQQLYACNVMLTDFSCVKPTDQTILSRGKRAIVKAQQLGLL